MKLSDDVDDVMFLAASFGHIDIVKFCKEWGATDFDRAMTNAARRGHIDIVKLCKKWGGQQILTPLWMMPR